MSRQSLEDALKVAGNPVDFLRNSQYPPVEFPVRPEFTNWREEQEAWRKTCALLDQSQHMDDLFLSGPDALRLLSEHSVNTYANFSPGSAKQFIVTNSQGYMIGDSIVFHMDEGQFDIVGNPSVQNWILFAIETGGYDVQVYRCPNANRRQGPPRLYRYEIQGPNSEPLMEHVTGGPIPRLKFFHMNEMTIAGHRVWALRHGMAGQPGYEIFGPWEEGEAVLAEILAAGDAFGLRRAGAKAYSTANLESGWLPKPPVTAIFGEEEKTYREWLPADTIGSLAGSMYSSDITDYYVTPYDIGYGRMIKFDHAFKGREALERMADKTARRKVTLVWHPDDVAAAIRTQYEPGLAAKSIDWPKARYGFFQADLVRSGGRQVGVSMDVGYIHNEHAMISLATLDKEIADGAEVSVLWGEDPVSAKPGVEPHRQVEIRATVAPVPYAQVIRESYRG